MYLIKVFIPTWMKFRGVYRNHSLCPSVQIFVQPITFCWFDIGLPYLAHGCITMRGCVAYRYIHDPDRMLILTSRSNLQGLWRDFLSLDKVILCLAQECITMVWSVAYIYDLDLWPEYQSYIFTMNLSLARSSLLFDIPAGIPNFGILMYHNETTCCEICMTLTFMWVAGSMFSEFYSQFLSC